MSPNDEMCLNSWWPVANQNEKRKTTMVFYENTVEYVYIHSIVFSLVGPKLFSILNMEIH